MTRYLNLRGRVQEGIDNAFTMEEPCAVIKQFGVTFYAEPKDCPHLDLDGSLGKGHTERENVSETQFCMR